MTVIRVGEVPALWEGKALWLDGARPEPQRVTLRVDEQHGSLGIFVGRADPVLWPLVDIRRVRDQAGGELMILRDKSDPVARLIVSEAEDKAIFKARADRMAKAPPIENKGRLLAWATGAVASVALMVFVLIPFLADNLAGLLPPSGQRALGETTFEQIRGALDQTGLSPVKICEAPDGAAALAEMGARLFPEAVTEAPLTVFVLDHEMINAFALPGGIVVFMRGLIDEAESPDEVAAVYAHEVGHVVARDPSRIALRSAGSIGVLGLLLGDFAGGAAVLFLANRIIEADYSQQAEANADSFSHEYLLAAGVRPDAMATFFDRLREKFGETGGIVQHFMAHPKMGDRIEAARAATPPDAVFTPILDPQSWTALQGICDS